MRRRWRVRCVSVDGVTRFEGEYVFKRSALEDARRLSSPIYDTIVERTDGSLLLVWAHQPPDEFARNPR